MHDDFVKCQVYREWCGKVYYLVARLLLVFQCLTHVHQKNGSTWLSQEQAEMGHLYTTITPLTTFIVASHTLCLKILMN